MITFNFIHLINNEINFLTFGEYSTRYSQIRHSSLYLRSFHLSTNTGSTRVHKCIERIRLDEAVDFHLPYSWPDIIYLRSWGFEL